MGKPELYWWRVVRTGACFAAFGIGALVLGLVVFPVLLLVVRDEDARRRRVRAVVHDSFRLFVALMHRVGGFTYEIVGRERLGRPGQLIIANHPTLIDVVMIVGLTPAGCVVKEALFRNPFMRRVVQSAGYISNGSTASMIERAAAALRAGDTLVMFPEGTRTRPGEPLAFHRGAASVAIQAATVLTPVYITTNPVFLPKSQPWYRVPRTRPHLSLRVGEDLDLTAYRALPAPRASRMLNAWLQSHYSRVLGEDARYNAALQTQGPHTKGTTAGARITKPDRGVTSS
jgi:1-acyl-sn-glycerol-3-phosphate acyltransferase